MNALKNIVNWGAKIQLWIGVIVLLTIIASMTSGIFVRFIGYPFAWTEELCTVLFVWLSFMGTSIAAQQRRHLCVDFIVGNFSPSVARTVQIITLITILFFLVVLCIGSIALLPRTVHARSVALGIPRTVSYIPIAICSFYMFFAYLYDLLLLFRPHAPDNPAGQNPAPVDAA